MKKTFKDLRTFNIISAGFLFRDKNHPDTKLGYAIKRFIEKNVDRIMEEYNEELNSIRIDYCYTDSDGVILYDISKDNAGNEIRHFKFTKEGMKSKTKAEKELLKRFDAKEYEVEPYIATEIPENLTLDEIGSFTGLVIPDGYINASENGMKEKKRDTHRMILD